MKRGVVSGGAHRRRGVGAWRWVLLVALAVVAGAGIRVWVYRSVLGVPDSDEAVVGLMTLHAMDGELATFFWGQAFNGSQEALLTVPVFFVAGSSWLTLRLVPIVLSAAAAVVVWRVGRRTIGEPAAVAAGCVAWVWPPFVAYKGRISRASMRAASSTRGCCCCSRCAWWSGRRGLASALSGSSSGWLCGRARSSCR